MKRESNNRIVLSELINKYINEDNINDNISIYVHEFTNKYPYAYNVNENFFATSIYKIPLALVYYEKINRGDLSLEIKLLYESNHYEIGGSIGDNYTVGSYIAIDTLLHNMIIYSDNTFAFILFENLGD